MNEKLAKYFLGELEQHETVELFNQLEADTSLKNEYIRLRNVRALSHLSALSKNETEARSSFQRFSHLINIKKRRKIIRLSFQYAAVAILLIASTFFLTLRIYDASNRQGNMNTLYVPAGQRAQLTLQDGTVVWLNAQSTLTYPSRFSGNERKVTVIGEAYFDVAKNPKKPFIVTTQNIDMKVLGTQFNVYSYPETGYIQTDLVEGSLKIYEKESEETAIILKPNEQIIVRDHEMTVNAMVNSDYFLWKNGIYTFNNAQLLDIIEKLQLYYDVKIIVKDPEKFNARYTGKFRQRDGIDEILRMLQKITPFSIEKDTELNQIRLKK